MTYKVIKPDAFFVIAGEEGDKKFYRRYAAAPADAADRNKLRGFVFIYPKARAKALDPVALAIANSFEAFPRRRRCRRRRPRSPNARRRPRSRRN